MSIMPGPRITAEQLLLRPSDAGRCELVHGEVRAMSPAGPRHGFVTMLFGARLLTHALERGLGQVYAADTGFVIERNPDTVLAPDAAFVRRERTPGKDHRGFFEGPPDLCVEVRSPTDSRPAMQRKARAWLQAGCQVVVNVDPESQTVEIWRVDAEPQTLRGDDVFAADDVIPGFRLRIADLFVD
ncbi:MAG: Uma2 family endonuclease [Planctomycetes bacterium]|nr:Uma2 family endonuclease [Planctomycetota bacterium]